jgi:hemin uptake protein HemP
VGARIAREGERSIEPFTRLSKWSYIRLTVTPLWPPTTGTTTSLDKERSPTISATKVDARTTSKVVTPKRLSRCWLTGSRATDTNLPLGIINTGLLEHLCDNRNGRINWVRDHEDECLGSSCGDPICKISDDSSVDLGQVNDLYDISRNTSNRERQTLNKSSLITSHHQLSIRHQGFALTLSSTKLISVSSIFKRL